MNEILETIHMHEVKYGVNNGVPTGCVNINRRDRIVPLESFNWGKFQETARESSWRPRCICVIVTKYFFSHIILTIIKSYYYCVLKIFSCTTFLNFILKYSDYKFTAHSIYILHLET